ncbi:FKBP-type peptidyl-prolyl cis-trans isomerase [Mycobacterium yunnanensis]|uniref:Peptidyl-prolyl cis-trans isomerase n=1 Tax=Mycobacterium yunnanensis TaxID=368477 RepID=A0A9X3BSP0_9MYCO|nr:FKBP-type peptidyl-prolyl cis-trans isomerase [Mycobacterium yunnanensis]MCV7420275.1 FKBP-type peptidyl-prolyl cis-trans isomerase [Mycobacterium yunnanensis]
MKSTRAFRSAAIVAGAAPFVALLAACGSDAGAEPTPTSPAANGSSSAVAAPSQSPVAASCPSAPPAAGGTPEWTLPGTTGNVAVTGSTDSAAPEIKVAGPFGVTATQVHTLVAGDGPVVPDTATVSVCYMGVNGRDGSTFDSSYERGEPAEFPLDGVVPGFQKAIAGQKVGSTVAVAMDPADGYPEGQPSAGIQKGDSLVFAIKILGITG